MKYWLMKSEPDIFGIEQLQAMPRKISAWDGVRNYQARNMMRDKMKKGDQVFLYHSSCAEPGIVGIMQVVKEAYPDHTALDTEAKYFDPKSDPDHPRWFMVDVQFKHQFQRIISLKELKQHALQLGDFILLKKSSRLSIMPVTAAQWSYILKLESGPTSG